MRIHHIRNLLEKSAYWCNIIIWYNINNNKKSIASCLRKASTVTFTVFTDDEKIIINAF